MHTPMGKQIVGAPRVYDFRAPRYIHRYYFVNRPVNRPV